MKTFCAPASIVAVVLIAFAASSSARANLLTNGDFEATPFPSGWTATGTVTAETSNPISGTTSARMSAATTGTLRQNLSQSVTDFAVDFLVRAEFESLERSLNVILRQGLTNVVNLRLSGTATGGAGSDLQLFNGSTWVTISGTNFFAINSIYHIQIVGHGWGEAGANYDVLWSDAGSTTLNYSANSLAYYQNTADTRVFDQLIFLQTSGTGNSYGIDNVNVLAIPSPAALPVWLTLIGLGAFKRRR